MYVAVFILTITLYAGLVTPILQTGNYAEGANKCQVKSRAQASLPA